MDPLTQQLLQRQLAAASQPTPTIHTQVPPQDKRFANAQAIQEAYRNGWSPNPILLRAQLGHTS